MWVTADCMACFLGSNTSRKIMQNIVVQGRSTGPPVKSETDKTVLVLREKANEK